MIRPSLMLAPALFFASSAFAQACPPGAATSATLASGTDVRVIGLSTEDAYYDNSYSTVMGVEGVTTDQLTNQGGCWYSGPINGKNGDSYYFYKVALSTSGGSAPASTSCPAGSLRGAPTTGSTYRVMALHPDDAYASGSSVRTGLEVRFGEGTTVRDGCWISGPATSSTGDLYFFKVAVEPVGGSGGSLVMSSCPSNAHTGPIPAGSTITLLGVHPDDAYSNGAGSFRVGQTMTADANMNNNGGCWYGGATSWSGGGSAYFYKAAFTVGGSAGGLPTDKASSSADIVGSIEALYNNDTLDDDVERILLTAYDRDGSGTINTLNELNGIPCAVFTAVNRKYQAKWSVSVRAVLGFKSNLSWVGNAIGFTENLREPGDRQMSRCGIQ